MLGPPIIGGGPDIMLGDRILGDGADDLLPTACIATGMGVSHLTMVEESALLFILRALRDLLFFSCVPIAGAVIAGAVIARGAGLFCCGDTTDKSTVSSES